MPRVRSFRAGCRPAAALVGVALLTGCTMCPDPYDYSGPVPNGSVTQNDFRARSNGIAPIGVSPRPWPPLVRKEAKPAAGGPTRMAAKPSGPVPPKSTATKPAEPVAQPSAGRTVEVVDVVGEEPAAGGDDSAATGGGDLLLR